MQAVAEKAKRNLAGDTENSLNLRVPKGEMIRWELIYQLSIKYLSMSRDEYGACDVSSQIWILVSRPSLVQF